MFRPPTKYSEYLQDVRKSIDYILSRVNSTTVGTLQQVTNAGSTTTNAITTGGITTDYVQLNTLATPTLAPGMFAWNDAFGTADLRLKGGNVTLQLGQETLARVVNKTGADLLESQYRVVRVRIASEGGSQGQRLAVVLAQGNNDPDSVTTLGIVTETILNNQEGFITVFGNVNNIDTTGSLQGETWLDGDVLYLSPTIPGALTKVKPIAPNHSVTMGYVIYAHGVNGKIFVKVDNGYELDELHNVRITAVANNDLLQYDSVQQVWKNVAASVAVPTPTLAQVTTAGNTTTNAITVGNATVNGPVNSVFAHTPTTNYTGFGGVQLNAADGTERGFFKLSPGTGEVKIGAVGSGYFTTLHTAGVERMRIFFSSGNVAINTTTDAGYKLDVNGTVRAQGKLTISTGGTEITGTIVGYSGLQVYGTTQIFSGNAFQIFNAANNSKASFQYINALGLALTTNVDAVSGVLRGLTLNSTLVAAANNDVLVGLDINPTFTNGAFTGVANLSIRGAGWIQANGGFSVGSNAYSGGIPINGLTISGAVPAKYYVGSGGGFSHSFRTASNDLVGERLRITDAFTAVLNGNLLVNTTTDAGYKLDVAGTIRSTGTNGLILYNGTYGAKVSMSSYVFTIEREGTYGITTYLFKYNDGTAALSLSNNTTILGIGGGDDAVMISRTVYAPHNAAFGFTTYGGTTKYKAIQALYTDNNTSGVAFNYKTGGTDTEAMRINSAGNVLIGTTTNAGYKLQVQGSGYFNTNTASTNSVLRLTDNTNGTAWAGFSPSISTIFFIGSNNGVTIGKISGDNSTPSTVHSQIVLNQNGASNIQLLTNVANTGIVFSDGVNATIRMNFPSANEAAITTISSHNLSIGVASSIGSLSSTTMKFFQSTGNVTIGTTTDAGYKLDVNGTVRTQVSLSGTPNIIHVSNLQTDGGPGGAIAFYTGGVIGNASRIVAQRSGPVGQSDIQLETNGVTRLFVSVLGNIGLGTTNPTELLHIVNNTTGNKFARISAGAADASAAWVAQNDQVDNIVYRVFGSGVAGFQMGIALARSASLIANLDGTGKFLIGTYSNTDIIFGTGDQSRIRVSGSNGNVMIGTLTDIGTKLNVSGEINSAGYRVNNVFGWSGTINIPTTPPISITVDGGIITNVV